MLDSEALARRMQQLDGHVDRILESAGGDERLALMAVAEGRRNVDTLMRLLVVHAAERHDTPQNIVDDQPTHVIDQRPETIRTVLRMLIESGAALLPDEEQPEPQAPERDKPEQPPWDGSITPAV